MLANLGARLGVDLAPRSFKGVDGSRVDVDGVSDSPLVLCEVCAHHGRLKAGQLRKLIADAFKLVYVEKLLKRSARKVLLLADDEAAARLKGRSWVAEAMQALAIEVQVVKLGRELRARVEAAQVRQYR